MTTHDLAVYLALILFMVMSYIITAICVVYASRSDQE